MNVTAFTPTEIEAFRTDASVVVLARYTSIVTLALVVYEYVVTFDAEVRLIWPSRLSFAKVAFLLSRYIPFASIILEVICLILLPNEAVPCRTAAITTAFLQCSQFVVAECLMFMRTYALWGRKRPIFLALLAVFLAGTGGAYYLTGRFILAISTRQGLDLFPSGCLVVFSSNQLFWVGEVLLMAGETFTLSLLLLKRLQDRNPMSKLMKTMYQDGLFYYLCVLASSITGFLVILHAVADIRLGYSTLTTQCVLHSILCNRLLLRLRGAYESIAHKERPNSFARPIPMQIMTTTTIDKMTD